MVTLQEKAAAEEEEVVRVVSLLPSLTEVVADLGLGKKLVGITHECDYPKWVTSKAQVVTESHVPSDATQREIDESVRKSLVQTNSLYALKEQVLKTLKPSHVLTQSLCDVCAVNFQQVQHKCSRLLADAPYKLLSIEPQTLEDVRESLELVGANLGCERQAIDEALQRFDSKRSEIRARVDASLRAGSRKRPKVALLEWFDPLFYGGHWIKEMVVDAGGTYELCEKGQRSKVMTQDDLLDYDPDVIILAPCGFGIERCVKDAKTILYKGEHFKWWSKLRAVQGNQVFAADGNQYFSRPSPRLVEGIEILADILHHHHEETEREAASKRWVRLKVEDE